MVEEEDDDDGEDSESTESANPVVKSTLAEHSNGLRQKPTADHSVSSAGE